MAELPPPGQNPLQSRMQRVSLWVSAVALTLMTAGLLGMAAQGDLEGAPGPATWTPFHPPTTMHWGLVSASLGIALLGMLPAIRVALIAVDRLSRRALRDALVVLIVLLELLYSMTAGRH